MTAHKRHFSPTIDEIRQYNIKRQRLLDDLDALSLSGEHTVKQYHQKAPIVLKDRTIIPDIDEFLLLNQDDADVLETSRHVWDLDEVDVERLVIPDVTKKLLLMGQRTSKELNWALVPYVDDIVYRVWEKWWWNVYKLREMEGLLGEGEEDDDLMIDDNYNEPDDDDQMDLD